MHIGKKNPIFKCEESYIDCWETDQSTATEKYLGKVKVQQSYTSKYLGEMISSDGTNTANIAARKRRGFGTVKDICSMLDNMCLGPYMVQKAVVLRNSMLVGTLLTCSEAWYNVSEAELGQLEQVDKSLWTSILEVARTVPYDLVCLELGIEPIRYIVMRRRLIYLQHILRQKETSLVKNFFKTQLATLKKKDWGTTVKEDLKHLNIEIPIEEIEHLPKATYIKLIKKKIYQKSFEYLLDKRNTRNGKGMQMCYQKLEIQNYLSSEDIDITNHERKLIFQLRTSMNFKIKSHFRRMHESVLCEGCHLEESNTKHTLQCNILLGRNELVSYIPDIEDLYGDDEDEQVYIARLIKDNMGRLPT